MLSYDIYCRHETAIVAICARAQEADLENNVLVSVFSSVAALALTKQQANKIKEFLDQGLILFVVAAMRAAGAEYEAK